MKHRRMPLSKNIQKEVVHSTFKPLFYSYSLIIHSLLPSTYFTCCAAYPFVSLFPFYFIFNFLLLLPKQLISLFLLIIDLSFYLIVLLLSLFNCLAQCVFTRKIVNLTNERLTLMTEGILGHYINS